MMHATKSDLELEIDAALGIFLASGFSEVAKHKHLQNNKSHET
jgi:hypothetical protein